jgi:hypothetical protein
MRDSIHKYFQVGTIQWMSHPARELQSRGFGPRHSLRRLLRRLRDRPQADDATRDAVKRMLEQSHLKVCYGAQPRLLGPGLNPNDIDEAGRKRARRRFWRRWMKPNTWRQGHRLSGGQVEARNDGAVLRPAFKNHRQPVQKSGSKGHDGGA